MIEYSCVYSLADGADDAEECSKLHYYAEKDRLFEVKAGLGFVCVNLRDLRETLGLICANRLSPLACYSPADYADHAEECSPAALFRRERQFGVVEKLMQFCCLSA